MNISAEATVVLLVSVAELLFGVAIWCLISPRVASLPLVVGAIAGVIGIGLAVFDLTGRGAV